MRLLVIWLLAATISVAVALLAFFPAAWISSIVESQTAGRLSLGDAQGTLWRGSAFIGGAPSSRDPVTPLLPGRFSWRLSPMVLFGIVDGRLENDEALSQAVNIVGNWSQWQVSACAIHLPIERLSGLGAPLNTIAPSGRMSLSWDTLELKRQDGNIEVNGKMILDLDDIGSKLSPIKPLGAYQMVLVWHGREALVSLKSIKGPLLLEGAGKLTNGRLQFSGKAEAAQGQEETLANLLNLLGQRRRVGDKNIIALELK